MKTHEASWRAVEVGAYLQPSRGGPCGQSSAGEFEWRGDFSDAPGAGPSAGDGIAPVLTASPVARRPPPPELGLISRPHDHRIIYIFGMDVKKRHKPVCPQSARHARRRDGHFRSEGSNHRH